MKNILLFTFLMTLFASCSRTVQVFELQSSEVERYENDIFAFENEDLAIAYDFWIDGGVMLFNVTNRTDEDIYIDFSQSQFVINGEVFDFYNDLYLVGAIQVENSDILPPKLEKIPSQSSETIEGFPVTFDWQRLKRKHANVVYGATDSPYQFSNHIVYSKDETFEESQVLKNDFWVSNIEKMKRREFKNLSNSSSPKSDKFYVRRIHHPNSTLFWLEVGLDVLETVVFIVN